MPAMNSYPPYPTNPPSPMPGPDRTGTIASAVIGAACLLLTVAVVAFTSDELPSANDPGGGGTVPGDLAALGDPGGTAADDPPVTDSVVPLAELKRSFPLPPGTGPTHVDRDFLPAGTRAYDVRASLSVVRGFYEQRLPRLGYEWPDPLPTTTERNGGRIVGWHSPIWPIDQSSDGGYLAIDVNYLGGAPGVVTIRVAFYG